MSDMDLDLAEYDQVDEARFFMSQRLGLHEEDPATARDLIVTLSSSAERVSTSDDTNCENDFVFLPAAPTTDQARQALASDTNTKTRNCLSRNRSEGDECTEQTSSKAHPKSNQSAGAKYPTSLPADSSVREVASKLVTTQPQTTSRASRPLSTINSNGKNPFYNLHQISPESASSQAYQPFWMRPEISASKPIGVLEIDSHNALLNPNVLSDLMHQIITKADSICIAIPCAYCHEPKACPPSDISSWLNHMNRAHNCKVCPICSKLVGLGPMRDIEIMKKHVVSHIDDEWLERRSTKTNFSFGLQQHWFAGARCQVKDPRSMNNYKL